MTAAAGAPRTFLPREIALAWLGAILVEVAFVASFYVVRSAPALDMPDADKGASIPVKVIPVLDEDSPLLKAGGKRDPMKLPDRWIRKEPVPRIENKAVVTTKASKAAEDVPEKNLKVASARVPPDAPLAKQVDVEMPMPSASVAPANVDIEGSQDGSKDGTETDPLKARAVDLYRQRIIGWFTQRFRVTGSGLSQDELTKFRVGARVSLSADRRVTSFTITPSGNAAFDGAANATLSGAQGEALPPPPENYPDIVQSTISLTFVCRKDQCN